MVCIVQHVLAICRYFLNREEGTLEEDHIVLLVVLHVLPVIIGQEVGDECRCSPTSFCLGHRV